jgi:hypothetical protein
MVPSLVQRKWPVVKPHRLPPTAPPFSPLMLLQTSEAHRLQRYFRRVLAHRLLDGAP